MEREDICKGCTDTLFLEVFSIAAFGKETIIINNYVVANIFGVSWSFWGEASPPPPTHTHTLDRTLLQIQCTCYLQACSNL